MRIPKFGWVTGSGETTECLIKKKKSGIWRNQFEHQFQLFLHYQEHRI
jgi:hypothetical protein